MYHLARTVSFNMPGVHVMGLSVSSTDDHIAITTACRRLLMLDLNSLPLEQQQVVPAAQLDNAQQSDEQELEDQVCAGGWPAAQVLTAAATSHGSSDMQCLIASYHHNVTAACSIWGQWQGGVDMRPLHTSAAPTVTI